MANQKPVEHGPLLIFNFPKVFFLVNFFDFFLWKIYAFFNQLKILSNTVQFHLDFGQRLLMVEGDYCGPVGTCQTS